MASQAANSTGVAERHGRSVPVGLVVVAYVVAGTLWILGSGSVADMFTEATSIPRWIVELGKGVVFVVVTALLLLLVLRRRAVRLDAVAARGQENARQLSESEDRNRLQATALSGTANAVVITDVDGTIEWVNAAFETMSGYPASVAVGATPRLVCSGVQDEAFYRDLWGTILAGQVWRGQVVNRRSDGALYTVSQTITPMVAESGGVQRFVAIQEDITERIRTAGALEHLATCDPLTALPNRALFTDRLGLARAALSRTGGGFVVLFLDLDNFKTINGSLGHGAGDEILQMAGTRLQEVVRPADTVARFGGDEFAILCPDLGTRAAADEVARRLQRALSSPFDTSHGQLMVTASIGIVLGDATTDSTTLLRDVDAAMHAAKERGRNRIEHFDTRLHELAQQRLETTAQVRDAIAGEGVVVQYQPTIELATGKMVGVEALVRLRQRDGSLLAPDRFVSVAEDAGLIGALGERVLEVACAEAAAWLAADPDLMVAVNLSAHQFTDPDLPDTIVRSLDAGGIPAANLWLEITESALLTGPQVQTAIRSLRRLGVSFAIDDFGTGYSSLAHLRDTPVDALKIDRGFVAGMLDSPRDRALIVASLDLARAFGLRTIAEGVETHPQRRELTQLGCDYAQGYLWSPPVAAEHIGGMMANGSPLAGGGPVTGILGGIERGERQYAGTSRAVSLDPAGGRREGRTGSAVVPTGAPPTHDVASLAVEQLQGTAPMIDGMPPSQVPSDAAVTVNGVTRQLLHAESAAEVRDILLTAVHQLGGTTVVADQADDDALPVDLTMGAGVPLLPTAEPDSIARMHLERYLPGLLADARQALDVLARTQRLSRDATTDHLTQLGNRATFVRLLSRLGPSDLVVALDLDDFKEVNDVHGHSAGDDVLREFATCLRDHLRVNDHAVRFGGDEFALVLTGTDIDGGMIMLDRLRAAWYEQRSYPVNFSAGIARSLPSSAESHEAADRALYAAKAAGKGETVVAGRPTDTDDRNEPGSR